jgi:hypothetical protein
MARERPPKYLSLNPEAIKGYRPPHADVYKWHVVADGRQENFKTIAARYFVPVEQILEFNFPGSVEDGRVVPEIVNWYLRYHNEFGCPETHDRINRIFKGGEKIAIPRAAGGAPRLPTLAEAKKWFVEKVIPMRTAARGYSANRFWKTPRGWLSGNTEDANGLCGDATLFVAEEYYRQYKDYRTSDGYIIGMVLWDGGGKLQQNHIANVMLLQDRTRKETYIYDSAKQQTRIPPSAHTMHPVRSAPRRLGQYNTASLLALWVFDLYYKMPPHTLGHWWTDRDRARDGVITIGLQTAFMD